LIKKPFLTIQQRWPFSRRRVSPGGTGIEERVMDDVATNIIEILRKNMKSDSEKEITMDTPLNDLDIESLDLAVIVFDIEDKFGIEIPYNANEENNEFSTVGSVVEKVRELIAENATA
jgi:acyl carrier protein